MAVFAFVLLVGHKKEKTALEETCFFCLFQNFSCNFTRIPIIFVRRKSHTNVYETFVQKILTEMQIQERGKFSLQVVFLLFFWFGNWIILSESHVRQLLHLQFNPNSSISDGAQPIHVHEYEEKRVYFFVSHKTTHTFTNASDSILQLHKYQARIFFLKDYIWRF